MRFETDLLRQCWFLTGPTASGKTDVGAALADRLDAEIISLDSMCLYRGMDIGTAKPSPEMRRRFVHHLLDVLEPHEEFTVADYLEAARQACLEALGRGHVPLFIGGTGLYLRAVLRGVFEGPKADWAFRQQMEALAGAQGPDHLHRLLQDVDPATAARLHPNDQRRIVRALEVHHLTGQPLSEQQRQPVLPPNERPRHVYWLSPPRDWLYQRIDTRVESMIDQGLVDEVSRLLAQEQPLSRTARQALGYKEIIDYLESGISKNEAVDLIQKRTRQFAKRQHTWFRNLVECIPIPMTGDESPAELADRILALAGRAEDPVQ